MGREHAAAALQTALDVLRHARSMLEAGVRSTSR
jgi:hypothetical protein